MTISNNYVPVRTSGDGVTTNFSGAWQMIAAGNERVYWEDKTTGVQTLKTVGVDYTLAFDESGFTVTFLPGKIPPNTVYVVIGRVVTEDQNVPYKTSTGFDGKVVENSFDKLTAMVQDVQEQVDRSVQFPLGSAFTATFEDIPQDGYGIVWDGTTGALRNTASSLAVLEGNAATVAANITSINTVAGSIANVNSVAGDITNINIVAGDHVPINTVAGDHAAILVVAGDHTVINTVAGDHTAINTVAGDHTAINTVAGDHTQIVAVAADLTNINAVAADLTNIDIAANNIAAINAAPTYAAQAAAAVVAVANQWLFSTTTTMANPGTGLIRANNASMASATQFAFSALTNDTGNPNVRTLINTWDDSTHNPRAIIRIAKNASNFVVFGISGTITDNTTWLQIPVTYINGAGSFAASDILEISVAICGNDGAGGVTTTGTPTTGSLVQFSGSSTIANADLTGDVTTSATLATTIGANKVTNAKLATMAANTVKANATAGAAVPTDVALSASTLLGMGSTGSVAPITVSGGSFSGTVLTVNGVTRTEYNKGTYSTGTAYTQAHGLGSIAAVKSVEVWLACTTADNGYAIGDRIQFPWGSAQSIGVWVNATTVAAVSAGTVVAYPPKTGGTWTNLTAASWQVIIVVLS